MNVTSGYGDSVNGIHSVAENRGGFPGYDFTPRQIPPSTAFIGFSPKINDERPGFYGRDNKELTVAGRSIPQGAAPNIGEVIKKTVASLNASTTGMSW